MLSNLSSRLHNLLITGVNLIDEDFRLQKAIEDFAVFKDKNPIFKKINDGLNKLLNDEEDKTSLLLSLISLVDAVNLTQAKFEEENDIEEIEYDEVKSIKQYKYSEISPIIDAFNSTGSGRYDIVKSAYNDKKELFEDYRVIKAVIKGLNDSYSELASLAFEILEETKINIVPELKDNFDKDGKSDMVRRLQLIGKLACDKENDFYLSLINDSSVAIRVIAISILPQSESNKKLVLDLINSEKGKVKKAAIVALGRYDCKESYEYFKKLIEKDKSYDEYLCLNTNDELSDAIAEKLDKLLYEIIENNDNGVVSEKLIKKIKVHFPGIQNKTSDKMIKFLSRLGDNEKLLKSLCGIDKLPIFYDYENTADTQMRTVYEYISSNITRTIMYANNPKYNEAIVKFNEESHSDIFFEGALTYMFMKDCTNIYDYIEKYLYKASTTDIIYNVINHICFIDNGTNYLLFYRVRDKNPVNERIISSERELNDKLDIRLVKLLTLNTKPPVRIPGRNMTNNTLIPRRVYSARLGWLINPNDKESLKYFREYFYNKCHEKGVIDYELDALNKCDNEDWDNILVNLMKYNSKEKYNSWYVKGFIMSLETANEGLLKEIASVISVFKSDPLGMIEDIKEKYEELKAKNCGGQNE